MTQYIIASANRDKAAEMRRVLTPLLDGELLDRPADIPDIDETGETLEANALLKARAIMQATGLPAIADDTVTETHDPSRNMPQLLPVLHRQLPASAGSPPSPAV